MENKLIFFIPPEAFKSGNDIISSKFIDQLNSREIKAISITLWPNNLAKRYFDSFLPRRIEFKIIKYLLYRKIMNSHAKKINKGDIAWIWPNAVLTDEAGYFERKITDRGGKVVFHFMDDWFSINLGNKLINRSKYVKFFVVPTEHLQARVKQFIPKSQIEVLTEAVDISRVYPPVGKNYSEPFNIVWTGSSHNFYKIHQKIEKIINQVNDVLAIKFILISGEKAPRYFNPSFPWNWYPYDYKLENIFLSGCHLGLSILENNSIYEQCKGNYKVKTYLAAGLPVVASDFGYNRVLIQNAFNGYLVNNNETDWSRVIIHLFNNIELLKRLSTNARRSAIDNFSYTAIELEWHKFIQSI